MRTFSYLIATTWILCTPMMAQDRSGDQRETRQIDNWKRELKDRSKRGTLHDAFQKVRGDSGKWNDDPKLQHAPPLSGKPNNMSLDEWYDQMDQIRRGQLTPSDDNWLLFKTEQLDDNDRVWIERIDRHGNQFTVTLNQAIWQGRYQKTFTYYNVFGVNFGELAPGDYEAKWIIKPLVFNRFEGNGRPRDQTRKDNWPQDEQHLDREPVELHAAFSVTRPKD